MRISDWSSDVCSSDLLFFLSVVWRTIHAMPSKRGVRIEFVKESLAFSGEDSPMANLMLSVMGAFAEFERALIRERQREGIAVARQRGAYRGRKRSLSDEMVAELHRRVDDGERKAVIDRKSTRLNSSH